jgi:hypothetical protein
MRETIRDSIKDGSIYFTLRVSKTLFKERLKSRRI